VKAVEYFLLPLPAPLQVLCFRVRFRFLTLEIFLLPLLAPDKVGRFRVRFCFLTLEIFLLPLLAPDKVGRFRVRFRFKLILSKRFRFLQNFTASSFHFLRFLSNCMLFAQHKTENLVCRKSVKFTA